jgi:signal transduction histidine kinase
MNFLARINPRHFRLELFGRSLSGRVLWFTVGIILLVELVILMPNLGRERQTWLIQHLVNSHLAAAAASESSEDAYNPVTRDSLLKLADVQSIRMDAPGQLETLIQGDAPAPPGDVVDLANETLGTSTWRATLMVLGLGASEIEVVSPSPVQPDTMLDITVNGDAFASYLRIYAGHVAMLSVIIALVTGLLVFAALDRQLVRPMRIITESIVGFRKDPEQSGQGELVRLASRQNDEISGAARELKLMQDEMRAALWRNARLAAVGTAVAKISHDLRNILSSALLVADRLHETPDPLIQRAANTLITAVERATQLVSRTVDFAREGPPPVTRSAVAVRELVDEAAQMIRPDETNVTIDNQVPANLVLALDRSHIYRVLLNLMRNAVEAGASLLSISVRTDAGVTCMTLRDNGPGLPLRVQDNLFKPFTGSGRHGGTGLGLAIARDLIRAHGGDLVMADTGIKGTVFVMELAVSEFVQPEANRHGFALHPLPMPAPPAAAVSKPEHPEPEPAAPQKRSRLRLRRHAPAAPANDTLPAPLTSEPDLNPPDHEAISLPPAQTFNQ